MIVTEEGWKVLRTAVDVRRPGMVEVVVGSEDFSRTVVIALPRDDAPNVGAEVKLKLEF